MTISFDVIVVGDYSVDLIFTGMSEFPQLGKDIQSKDFKMTPGEAFIAAITMHRLGLKVGWAADFGNDEFSRFAIDLAREEGMDESLFIVHDHPYRRISVSASYPAENAYLTYYDPDPHIPAVISAIQKSQAKAIFIPGLYSGALIDIYLKLIRLKKMKIVMDGNSSQGNIIGRSKESLAIRKALKNTDIFLPNSREARRLTGETDLESALRMLGAFCPLVVVKDGRNGCLAYTKDTLFHVPGIQVDSIDTTGAGDCFDAGFMVAYMNEMPLEDCMKWGNITGGLSTTEPGGTTKRINVQDVNNYFSRYYP